MDGRSWKWSIGRCEEPWKRSLVTSPLIQHLRNRRQRVVCVHNINGRARLLACRTCKALQRCESAKRP